MEPYACVCWAFPDYAPLPCCPAHPLNERDTVHHSRLHLPSWGGSDSRRMIAKGFASSLRIPHGFSRASKSSGEWETEGTRPLCAQELCPQSPRSCMKPLPRSEGSFRKKAAQLPSCSLVSREEEALGQLKSRLVQLATVHMWKPNSRLYSVWSWYPRAMSMVEFAADGDAFMIHC